jgi:hypothetical protein
MPDQHELSAFAEVLNSSEKPILVGGQAVNLWAEHYASAVPELDPLRPFMSKDADIFGDRAMAERIAAATNWKLTCYNEPRTIAIAMLTKELSNKPPLLVEVINSVNGLRPRDLSDPDLLELRPGQFYRVLSPVMLLKAKLANVAQIDQARRQDVRHVKMLVPCVREYLREAHSRTLSGEITERALVDILENARDLSVDPQNLVLAKKHGFDLTNLFPPELTQSKLQKVARFVQFRLPGIAPPSDLEARQNPPVEVRRLPGERRSDSIGKELKSHSEWSLDDFLPDKGEKAKDRELEL